MTLVGALAQSRGPIRLLLALLCLACGLVLAWHHPLSPTAALVSFYVGVVALAWRPGWWLFAVPASLPFLNFWPWTGWQAFDEFDLLLLAALAGGYVHGALRGRAGQTAARVQPVGGKVWGFNGLMLALTLAAMVSLGRGLCEAGLLDHAVDSSRVASQAQTYESVWNVLRIAKSLVFALLFAPLLAAQLQTEATRLRAQRLFGSGMLAGLALVTLVALWERAAYPGLLEFSTRYRTTALFWEMHVGGAAIDAYWVIATPFLGWALGSARRPAVWVALAVLALLTCYAVLTTFSRGVYVAVLVPLILLALGAWARQRRFSLRDATARAALRVGGYGWRGKAGLVLALLLVSEVLGVVWGSSFVAERLASVQDDLDSRIAHWSRGINLLQTPLDWAFGKGLGRLPAHYAQISTDTEFAGSVRLNPRPQVDGSVVGAMREGLAPVPIQAVNPYQIMLKGPASNPELGGLFSLTQRLDYSKVAAYSVSLRARAQTESDVRLTVCEKHQIYEANCHYRFIKIRPTPDGQWQTLTIPLRGRPQAPNAGPWPSSASPAPLFPRFGVFSISVINAGGALALQQIGLDIRHKGTGGPEILKNGDFSHGLAGWLSSSQSYYLPWHIDNVYLELLIERGLLGLVLMVASVTVALIGVASSGVAQNSGADPSFARYLRAALVGAAMIGVVSSWLDVPRIAFLVFLLLFFSHRMSRQLPHDLPHDRKIQ